MDEQRVKFKPREQRKFIFAVLKKLKCNLLKDLLKYDLKVSYSSLKNYSGEFYFIPLFLLRKLCSLSNIDIKSLDIVLLSEHWGQVKGGKKGAIKMMEMYKKQLPLWRLKGNEKIARINTKKINYPELNQDLAEFIGAYLGDGTMTPYLIRISGDYRYDIPYFNYLSDLTFRLFGIKAKIIKDKKPTNSVNLFVRSKNICSFLSKVYDIKPGDKIRNKTVIPKKILLSEKLSIACLRGLIDTDGSVSRRGRNGSQFCINFTSHNPPLLNQVYKLGKKTGIFTYFTGNDTGTNKWENILKYFRVVGSSNLRHIIRFSLRHRENKTIYQREVPLYYRKPLYRNISLPFKMDL